MLQSLFWLTCTVTHKEAAGGEEDEKSTTICLILHHTPLQSCHCHDWSKTNVPISAVFHLAQTLVWRICPAPPAGKPKSLADPKQRPDKGKRGRPRMKQRRQEKQKRKGARRPSCTVYVANLMIPIGNSLSAMHATNGSTLIAWVSVFR